MLVSFGLRGARVPETLRMVTIHQHASTEDSETRRSTTVPEPNQNPCRHREVVTEGYASGSMEVKQADAHRTGELTETTLICAHASQHHASGRGLRCTKLQATFHSS